MSDLDKAQEIKRLKHQIGVSEQNFRLSGRQKHWAKAEQCKAALKALEQSK